MEKYSSHLQSVSCPSLERIRIQQEVNMLLREYVLLFNTLVKSQSLRMPTQVLNRMIGLFKHVTDLLVREICGIINLRELLPKAKQTCGLS